MTRRVRRASAAAVLAMAAVPPVPAAGQPDATGDVRVALSRAIAELRADIDGIGRLMDWQAALTRAAAADRDEALRQRLPMADCRASALAPLCDGLPGLFRPEAAARDADGDTAADGDADPAVPAGDGP